MPTGLLKGRHEGRQVYEIQIMHCPAHLPEARQFVKNDFRLTQINFSNIDNPPWLAKAQQQELEQRKTS